ncbi:hypothetical protein GC163_07570 [bacterium]|nr:hypothetical protein [bacterium]
MTLAAFRVLAVMCLCWNLAGMVGAQAPATTNTDPAPLTPAEAEEAPLPKLVDLKTPNAEELLRGKPVDWLVLLNQDVIFVEPVKPRPDTLAILKQRYEETLKIPTAVLPLEEKQAKLHELQRIAVTLLDRSEDPEYVIETRFLEKIIYFEDHILKRVALLLDERNYATAYELLMYVDRRHRGWPGFDEQYYRFLFLETGHWADVGQYERAMIQAEELFARKPDYPELARLFGRIIDGLLKERLAEEDYRAARHFLARLKRIDAMHPTGERWTQLLQNQAQELAQQARAAQQQQQHREASILIDQAVRIWPDLPELRATHRELVDRYQILRVGVVVPDDSSIKTMRAAYPYETAADHRHRQLCELPLFEPERVQDGLVQFRSRFIESWEPGNLGRDIDFRLRLRRAAWESRPVLTSGEIVASLANALDPQRPEFDGRFEHEVRLVSATSPESWRLQLTRIPLRIESRLRRDVPLTPETLAWSGDLNVQAATRPHQQRFFQAEDPGDVQIFQRTRLQPASPEPWHIAEVQEWPFPSWELALQALLRGEIDLIPQIDPTDLSALSNDSRFFVIPLALPQTHILQVHTASPLAQNASLRRALLHALDRSLLLKEEILLNAAPETGRLTTGPFAQNLSAYNRLLRSPNYDPIRAAALVATARKQLGGELPPLKIVLPPDPAVLRAWPAMQSQWKRVGLTVEQQIEPNGPWDLGYRMVQLTEPTDDLWSLLHPSGSSDWADLTVYPHWLRERLWDLEQTIDWTAAERVLHQIQAEFLVEARWIPLWEVDEHLIARRRMGGLFTRPMHPYQNIERWTLQSWYPTETP